MKRIQSLDVLRGFALCGIIFANIPPLLRLETPLGGPVPFEATAIDFLVQGRFFPIFSLLFGVSFALMWRGAHSRSAHPRVVLLRRLLLLGVIGVLHQILHPGEALLPYSIAALVFLLPATFLPRRWTVTVTASIGAALLVTATALGGGIVLIPGLFLLGFAAGNADLPEKLERSRTAVAVGLAVGIPATCVALWAQTLNPGFGGPAGLIMAATLCIAVIGAIQAELFPGLQRALAALGRTSLTNYVGATLIITLLKFIGDAAGFTFTGQRAWTLAMVAAVLILAAQAAVSTWWLRGWRQGPLEAMLRAFSWWQTVPQRRDKLDGETVARVDARESSELAAETTLVRSDHD